MARTVMMVLCVVLACMVVAAPYVEAISCGLVASSLAPCLGYLTNGGVVPQRCCSGVAALNNAATSTPDRQTACGCLKSAYAANSSIKPSNAASLPSKYVGSTSHTRSVRTLIAPRYSKAEMLMHIRSIYKLQ
ncbi:hypothetical protein L1887_18709 [Cichorium endivia]|nr:hypothetical protein L1887_18709 [Cichorium endivia]